VNNSFEIRNRFRTGIEISDYHYRQRTGINMDALSKALYQLFDGKYDDWLKIAIWHHSITGHEAISDEFLR